VRVDGQKPDMRRERRTSERRTAKSTSIKDAERRSGDCARKAVELTPGELSCVTSVPEKTRLIAFGQQALGKAKHEGRKPQTFDFLGLTHVCARSRKGKFTVHVRTKAKRFRRGLKAIAEWCKEHRHKPVDEQQKTLNAKLRGHYQYYGRPTNYRCLRRFYWKVQRIWHYWLSRRTRGKRMTWERYEEILRQHPLLPPRITHTWANPGSVA